MTGCYKAYSAHLKTTSTGTLSQNEELMRVFRDLDIVEQMGSGIKRILQAYPKSIYNFTTNFIRVVMPFASADQATPQATPQAGSAEEQVLVFCQQPKSRAEIQEHLGLKDRKHFREVILNPLLESGQLLPTLPDKPTSPKQKFYSAQGEYAEGEK